jgi:hypothetical protein
MDYNETVLMNFNIPPQLKSTFNLACRYKNISMTSQLNMLIDTFIKKEVFEARQLEWAEEAKNHPIEFFIQRAESNALQEDWY